MSEADDNQARITNLENDVATLQGENDRLNNELKLKEQAISELLETQKSLELQVKAANIDPDELVSLKSDKEKQSSHIIDLENKLKHYQSFEASRLTMEKQLQEIEEKSQKYLSDLVE